MEQGPKFEASKDKGSGRSNGIEGEPEEKIPPFLSEILKPEVQSEVKLVDKEDPDPDMGPEGEGQITSGSSQAHFYAENLGGLLEEDFFEQVKSVFEDRVMLDIGAGYGSHRGVGGGYEVAKIFKAKAYIGVEPYNFVGLAEKTHELEKETEEPLEVPISIVSEDGLNFLKKVEDSSVSIFTCATDRFILPDDKYLEELNEEVGRVVGENGFLGCDTVIRPSGLKHIDLEWNTESKFFNNAKRREAGKTYFYSGLKK